MRHDQLYSMTLDSTCNTAKGTGMANVFEEVQLVKASPYLVDDFRNICTILTLVGRPKLLHLHDARSLLLQSAAHVSEVSVSLINPLALFISLHVASRVPTD